MENDLANLVKVEFEDKRENSFSRKYRTIFYDKKSKRVYIPMCLLKENAYFCACYDGVTRFYSEEFDEYFVSDLWVRDREMLDHQMMDALKHLCEILYRKYKDAMD